MLIPWCRGGKSIFKVLLRVLSNSLFYALDGAVYLREYFEGGGAKDGAKSRNCPGGAH